MGREVILTVEGDRADGRVLGKYRSCAISMVNVAVYHRHLRFVGAKHGAVGNVSSGTHIPSQCKLYQHQDSTVSPAITCCRATAYTAVVRCPGSLLVTLA